MAEGHDLHVDHVEEDNNLCTDEELQGLAVQRSPALTHKRAAYEEDGPGRHQPVRNCEPDSDTMDERLL